MENLHAYLTTLTLAERIQFAEGCKTSYGYLRKAISVKQILGPELCVAIERATDGQVTRQDLRPEDYWLIWPDLPAPRPEPVKEGA